MRFDSPFSSSSSSDRVDIHPSSFLDSTSFLIDDPFLHLSKLHEQDQQLILHQPQFQTRKCMFGREDEWMQPSDFDFNFDFEEVPASQQQYSSSDVYGGSFDASQSYGEQWYSHQPVTSGYNQYPAHQYPHRRFASTSSVASGPESQLNRQASLPYQQYPSTHPNLSPYQNQQNTWTYDSSSPISTTQHLPTPVGTPKPDTSFQTPNLRWSRPTSGRDAAWTAAAHTSVRSALNQQWKPDSSLPPQAQSRSHSGAGMPRTAQAVNVDDMDAQVQHAAAVSVPKLDRTVSDAQADELYNPATFSQPPTTAPRTPSHTSTYLPTQPSVLQDRLRDANEARSASPSQASGQASDWRTSPYGDAGARYNRQNMPMQTAQAMRQKQKAESEAHERQQNYQKRNAEEPTTVSPRDAFPAQQVAKEDENLPSLFPTDSNQSNSSNVQYAPINLSSQEYGSYSTTVPQSTFSFTTPGVPASAQGLDFRNSYYQQHPPAVQYGPVNGDYPQTSSYSVPAHLTSMETTKSDESEPLERSSPESRSERPSPSDMLANGGRYTCTYSDVHGNCNARFDNGGDLNKHKRDVHRQAGPVNNNAKRATAMTQTGPHKCTRINPSTGKPCNTVFSRPYDLTRHEDTIHGEGKKLKCPHCPDEKLFSRNDALTRHLKVVHQTDQTPPAKARGRRPGA